MVERRGRGGEIANQIAAIPTDRRGYLPDHRGDVGTRIDALEGIVLIGVIVKLDFRNI